MRKIDLTGQRYGGWTVLNLDRREDEINFWVCLCDCGNTRVVRGYNLRNGHSVSCGCQRSTKLSARNKTGKHHTGDNNGKQREAKRRLGKNWISSRDYWFKKCAGRMHAAFKKGELFGFLSPQEFAVYCRSIAPTHCPVFGFELVPGCKKLMANPSIDKIKPELGYVRGNIQIISNKANIMKGNASLEELRQFAKWVLS